MREQLQQSVADVISRPMSAASVSAVTTASGVSTYFELISPVFGVLATIAGIMLSMALIYKTVIGIQLDRLKLKELEKEQNYNSK